MPPTPAREVSVPDHEIIVRPGLVARIIARIVPVAGDAVGGMEVERVFFHRHHRIEIAAAAEPPGRWRPEHPSVHVDGGHFRRAHVCHQRDARGPEARIVLDAEDAARGHHLLRPRCEGAVDLGDIHAHLLEHAPFAHHRHLAATGIFTAAIAFGFTAFEASGGQDRRTVLRGRPSQSPQTARR